MGYIAKQANGVFFSPGPLSLTIDAYFEDENREEEWCVQKPDVDNIEKFYLDCLSKVVITDDKYVSTCCTSKRYSKIARVEIIIEQL